MCFSQLLVLGSVLVEYHTLVYCHGCKYIMGTCCNSCALHTDLHPVTRTHVQILKLSVQKLI
jgi:hypothetical protein